MFTSIENIYIFPSHGGGCGNGRFTSLTNVDDSNTGFNFSTPSGASRMSSTADSGGFFENLFSTGGFFDDMISGGFKSLTNVTPTAVAPTVPQPNVNGGGFGTRSGGILKTVGGAPRRKSFTTFAPDTKLHDGLIQLHASLDKLVEAIIVGELSPAKCPIPEGREEVARIANHVYIKYALGNPRLCIELEAITTDLVNRLQALTSPPFRTPVLCGGGGNVTLLRIEHIPRVVFIQSLLRFACAQFAAPQTFGG
jgi:hypothetical protein